jgi:PleD family two-component response regulator
MTTAEIESLACTADLTELVNRRYLRAIMSGGLGIPAPSHRS